MSDGPVRFLAYFVLLPPPFKYNINSSAPHEFIAHFLLILVWHLLPFSLNSARQFARS